MTLKCAVCALDDPLKPTMCLCIATHLTAPCVSTRHATVLRKCPPRVSHGCAIDAKHLQRKWWYVFLFSSLSSMVGSASREWRGDTFTRAGCLDLVIFLKVLSLSLPHFPRLPFLLVHSFSLPLLFFHQWKNTFPLSTCNGEKDLVKSKISCLTSTLL